MLTRLYVEAPQFRIAILSHPRCPTNLLTENFQEAYEKSFNHSYEMLAAIVSNPNTPIELVEKVANAHDVPGGAVYPAQCELKRRNSKSE